MVQRKLTTDSSRTTRSESRHPASSTKPVSNSESESELESDSNDQSDDSNSSSSSDSQPDNSDQEKTYLLHRHLDYSYQRAPNQQQVGFDLFTSKTWKLADQQLNKFQQLNDTDLVQIHYPVPTKREPIRKLTLADILPPAHNHPSTSGYNNQHNKTRLPKLSPSPFAGPSVSSLYYSAYSSFAPCYDSTGSSQTLDQARMQYQSQRKIDIWSRRAERYHDVIIDYAPSSTENLHSSSTTNSQKKKVNTTSTRGRKRQKTSSSVTASTPTSSPAKDRPLTPTSPGKIRQEIDATLVETSKLITLLSTPRQQTNQSDIPQPSCEEIAEAYQLVQKLTSVIARRPRPAGSNDDNEDQSVIPSSESIRKSYQIVAAGTSEELGVIYNGSLPSTNPVGVHESTLITEPSPQLISVLEHTQRNTTQSSSSSFSTPRLQANLPMISSPHQHIPSSSVTSGIPVVSSRRDPSLSNARIGTPIAQSNGDYRPALNGHTVHSNISKLQLLQQQQQSNLQHHHHPSLQADIPTTTTAPSRPNSTLVNNDNHQQQRHLQNLQLQKLLSSSYVTNPLNHLMSTPPVLIPNIPMATNVPTIATPTLKPMVHSLGFVADNNFSNGIPHPNHRALASNSNPTNSISQ
ncbi:hypothetical protein Pst134EB_010871 [Puccinia striiformis f. sp. tritici]|nr:hypothetical protein Pst134EB_010871 [Puccinia striiformis f. sp. tritici]